MPMPTENPQFYGQWTVETDCALKVYKDKEFYRLDSKFVDLENTRFPATLKQAYPMHSTWVACSYSVRNLGLCQEK